MSSEGVPVVQEPRVPAFITIGHGGVCAPRSTCEDCKVCAPSSGFVVIMIAAE